MMTTNGEFLALLNDDRSKDISAMLNDFIHNGDDVGIFTHINSNSLYYDIASLKTSFNCNSRLFLSLNIQSIQSKFNNLINLINEIQENGPQIDIIALQETWNIPTLKPLHYQDFIL
jgi:hypothetical protein